jgi:hypothetical protein
MSDTEEIKIAEPGDLVPMDKIEPFYLTSGGFNRVIKGFPDDHLPKPALPHLLKESHFVEDPSQAQEEWTLALAEKVGTGGKCPYCDGGLRVDRKFIGAITKIRTVMPQDCRCIMYRNYYSRWMNPATVATGYQIITFNKLERYHSYFKGFGYDPAKPEASSAFKHLLETVTKYKHNCYLLTGDAGTGKTTLMTAMYQRALKDWAYTSFYDKNPVEAVWKVNATALAKQQRNWEMRNEGRDADTGKPTPLPTVTRELVETAVRAGLVPCLLIDEFDKIKLDSTFQLNEFSSIIDAIQSNGGQVVVSTNLSVMALRSALGEQHGPAIIRRLCGPRINPDNPKMPTDPNMGGFLVDCNHGTLTQKYQVPVSTGTDFTRAKVGVPSATYPPSSTSNPQAETPHEEKPAPHQSKAPQGGDRRNFTYFEKKSRRHRTFPTVGHDAPRKLGGVLSLGVPHGY